MPRLLLVLICLFSSLTTSAWPLDPSKVPEPLKPWVDWVLHDSQNRRCPFVYHNAGQHQCIWPSRLRLKLDKRGGEFEQNWHVYQDAWITLPGDPRHWPQKVKTNDKIAVVVLHNNRPAVQLKPGQYRIKGTFSWDRLPESLTVPANTGLVSLRVNNKNVRTPDLDREGRLWLKERDAGQRKGGEADKLELQVFRKIIDDLPLRLVTRVQLDVSGNQREVLLGKALFDGYIPLRLDSRLPARLEPDGRLRVQVRPGRWTVELEARPTADTTSFLLAASPQPWPRQEAWVFQAMSHLRLVEVKGNSIDPRQTGLPDSWQQLPAYQMKTNDILQLNVIRRGDPVPEPDRLALDRTLWLDFDGGGYTMQDAISGSMTQGWRLETQAPIDLGRVDIDGQPQFITRLAESGRTGVEVRRGNINLTADSRYTGSIRRVPTTGWAQDFHRVSAHLNLPPGWSLFAASGVDNVPQTWVNHWTLLDLFLVLLLSIAVMRLWSPAWGALALFSFALIWHEPLAPQWAWVHLLLAIALLRVMPEGKFRKVIVWYRHVAIVGLALIIIPFSVQQVRFGLYPQLERPWQPAVQRAPAEIMANAALELSIAPSIMSTDRLEQRSRSKLKSPLARKGEWDSSGYNLFSSAQNLDHFDPSANVQTGPGLPNWRWTRVKLGWNGPVTQDQQIGLLLIPPAVNSGLRFLRVVLVVLLLAMMLGVRYRKDKGISASNPFTSTAAVLLLTFGLLGLYPASDALAASQDSTLPSGELLKELKKRLLASPECLPQCAQISRMQLELDPKNLKLRLEIHAQQSVAIPLPSHSQHWLPQQVMVDGHAATSLYRDPGKGLWLGLKPGRYQVVLSGPLPARTDLSLPLPLKPHHVTVKTRGWTVEGVHENGIADNQLQLTRTQQKDRSDKPSALQPGLLPPFVRVERTLRLGLDWQVETRVVRASPVGTPVLLEVPLLRGESPLTPDIRIAQHKVLVNMSPSQTSYAWRSVLDKQVNITLVAPETTDWVEIWRVDLSPVWHLKAKGLTVVHHQDEQKNWLPEWRPWPGETVSLDITRPQGVEGRTLTIDSSQLEVSPGQRASEYSLRFSLRSSQGGQHHLQLPDNIVLQSLTINGRSQPIQQEGRTLTLPIVPGAQTIELSWRSDDGIGLFYRTSPIDLGSESNNANIRIKLARDRWALMAYGPRLGPAVLYWGLLIVLALLAFVLGRTRITPLKNWHWFLLAIGLSQVSLVMAAFIVAWLMAIGARSRLQKLPNAGIFNAMQVGLGLFTLIALSFLFLAVQQGLLGLPEMHVGGNRSTAYVLNWYQDRSATTLPQAWVLSVPLYVYRALMLLWALWLAFSLLKWLRWGWQSLNEKALWLNTDKSVGKTKAKALPEKNTETEGGSE